MTFARTTLAYAAIFLMIFGTVALVIFVGALAICIHWTFALTFILLPVWLAAMQTLLDWCFD